MKPLLMLAFFAGATLSGCRHDQVPPGLTNCKINPDTGLKDFEAAINAATVGKCWGTLNGFTVEVEQGSYYWGRDSSK